MRNTSRFEYKYILNHQQYYSVKHALSQYMAYDYYTKITPDNKYFVSSIYYDTYDLRAFHERNDGQYGRIKLRIRTYNEDADNSLVSVELKTKKGMAMLKYSSLVPVEYYYYYLTNGIWPINDDPVLNEFLRLQKVHCYSPQLIVQYNREGYEPKIDTNLRITFDHNVRSVRALNLFDREIILKPHRPKNIILEIKCLDNQPRWLSRTIRQHELKIVTNSKYVQGIEIVRPNMVTPRVEIGYLGN